MATRFKPYKANKKMSKADFNQLMKQMNYKKNDKSYYPTTKGRINSNAFMKRIHKIDKTEDNKLIKYFQNTNLKNITKAKINDYINLIDYTNERIDFATTASSRARNWKSKKRKTKSKARKKTRTAAKDIPVSLKNLLDSFILEKGMKVRLKKDYKDGYITIKEIKAIIDSFDVTFDSPVGVNQKKYKN